MSNTTMSSLHSSSTLIPPQRRRRWPRVLLAMLIFFAGLVTGTALTIFFAVQIVQSVIRHPESSPNRMAAVLRYKLSLTADQTPRVQEILAIHQQQIQEARRSIRPKLDAELDALRTEIDGVLTEPQRVQWEKLFDQTRARWMPQLFSPASRPAP